MADFEPVYVATINNEGGYTLTNDKDDAGGMTYAGISRVFNPSWEGWALIDRGEEVPTDMVRAFYRSEFWNPLNADLIQNQQVAKSMYDFAVNTSPKVVVLLVQGICGVVADGRIGPKTLAALNALPPRLFHAEFGMAKVIRYSESVDRRPVNKKYLHGWIKRVIKEYRS